MAVGRRGSVYLAGNTGGWLEIEFAVMHLSRRGRPDENFGEFFGMRTESEFSSADDVVIDKQGRILASGEYSSGFSVVRHLPD